MNIFGDPIYLFFAFLGIIFIPFGALIISIKLSSSCCCIVKKKDLMENT
jgi:hypothetical protein